MPYCEEHNEVYRAEECPKCTDGDQTNSSDRSLSSGDVSGLDDIVEDALDGIDDADGDVVVGTQSKSVDSTNDISVDRSTTVVDESTEVNDDNTTVTDSVIQGSDIGSADGGTEVEDSVVKDSNIGSEDSQDAVETDARTEEANNTENTPSGTRASGDASDTQFCIYCGDEIRARAANCPSCGEDITE